MNEFYVVLTDHDGTIDIPFEFPNSLNRMTNIIYNRYKIFRQKPVKPRFISKKHTSTSKNNENIILQ